MQVLREEDHMDTDKGRKEHALRSGADLLQDTRRWERVREDRDGEWGSGICRPGIWQGRKSVRICTALCDMREEKVKK